MVKSHVNTVVSLLTVSNPKAQVTPRIGNRIIAAITSFLPSCEYSEDNMSCTYTTVWSLSYLTSGFLSCPSLNLPAVTRYKLLRAVQRNKIFSYNERKQCYIIILFMRLMSLTNIMASIGPTNAQISPLSTEIQQLLIDKTKFD